MAHADEFRPHLADCVTSQQAEYRKENPDDPKRTHSYSVPRDPFGEALVRASSWRHKTCHSPSLFRLLEVMAKLFTVIWTLLASSSFSRTVPARPLPARMSSAIPCNVAVVFSRFVMAPDIV